MGNVPEIHQLLQIVLNILAVVAATQRQFANRQLFFTDIKKNERLNVVDVAYTRTVQFGLDHRETAAMKSFNSCDRVQIILVHGGPLSYVLPKKPRALSLQKIRDPAFRFSYLCVLASKFKLALGNRLRLRSAIKINLIKVKNILNSLLRAIRGGF